MKSMQLGCAAEHKGDFQSLIPQCVIVYHLNNILKASSLARAPGLQFTLYRIITDLACHRKMGRYRSV